MFKRKKTKSLADQIFVPSCYNVPKLNDPFYPGKTFVRTEKNDRNRNGPEVPIGYTNDTFNRLVRRAKVQRRFGGSRLFGREIQGWDNDPSVGGKRIALALGGKKKANISLWELFYSLSVASKPNTLVFVVDGLFVKADYFGNFSWEIIALKGTSCRPGTWVISPIPF